MAYYQKYLGNTKDGQNRAIVPDPQIVDVIWGSSRLPLIHSTSP